jgi:hypothetical protein
MNFPPGMVYNSTRFFVSQVISSSYARQRSNTRVSGRGLNGITSAFLSSSSATAASVRDCPKFASFKPGLTNSTGPLQNSSFQLT